jgi:hypothetical protein
MLGAETARNFSPFCRTGRVCLDTKLASGSAPHPCQALAVDEVSGTATIGNVKTAIISTNTSVWYVKRRLEGDQ